VLSQNKILVGAFVAVVTLAFLFKNKKSPETPVKEEKAIYADTLIPRGYVLVPIQLENIATVAALIDHYGVIDLYAGDAAENAMQLARKIKILRAPLNPEQYAVLAKEDLAKTIMKTKGPYWGVVQNRAAIEKMPEEPKIKKVKSPKALRIQPAQIDIEYYEGNEI